MERQGSKVAKALALEAQLRSVDGAVMEQLQSARSISDSGPSASLDSKVPPFGQENETPCCQEAAQVAAALQGNVTGNAASNAALQ